MLNNKELQKAPARRRATRHSKSEKKRQSRDVNYKQLVNPFEPIKIFSDDQIEHIHRTALRVLQELGVKILLPEAQQILIKNGCKLDKDSMICKFDSELVEQAMQSVPAMTSLTGSVDMPDVKLGGKHIAWVPVGGPPHISDLDNGKRTGTLEDSKNIIRLAQHFDVIHLQSPNVEPVDIAPQFRHYETMHAQLTLSNKPPFLFSRGAPQVEDGFKMIKIAHGLDDEAFKSKPHVWTVINTNSPLILDIPMSQGIIDFARAKQLLVITPFTLSGAMAPVTIVGAIVQQHAEFLSAMVLSQLVSPGTPLVYGAFTSNVDMKSGSPAFGTPEYVRACWLSGQLARHINVPWRSSMPCVSNCVDTQSTYETQMSMWGSVLGGANMTLHSAGWLEGGLTASLEKFIIDVEMLQQMAELMQPVKLDEAELAFEAMKEVGSGGHFFGTQHTLERFETAFYNPFVSDWSNFGQWVESGSQTATQRANGIWKTILNEFTPPVADQSRQEALNEFVNKRKSEGGALPES